MALALPDWDVDETRTTDQIDALPTCSDVERKLTSLVVIAGVAIGESFPIHDGATTIGRGRDAVVKLLDEGVSRAHARIHRDDDGVSVEDLGSRNGTYVNGVAITGRTPLREGDKLQIGHGCVLRFAVHDALDERFQRQMYDSSLRDALTRTYNKRYFSDRLRSELRFAMRHHAPLALLLLDLDRFKAINDTHGHLAGDRVLVAVADALAGGLRNEDVLARYGGEELAILLRAIPLANARLTAERLRRLVEQLAVPLDDGATLRVTVSIGVACFPDAGVTTADGLVRIADAALYRAKTAGRNRVES